MADVSDADPVSRPTVDDTSISLVRPNHQRKDSLEVHLKQRPARSDLIQKNILPASNAAPAIQAQQKELEKQMLADQLKDKISNRPAPEVLVKDGLLQEDPRSAEDRYLEAMEDEYAKREGGA